MSESTSEVTDLDLKATLDRALRTVGILALVGTPLLWRAWGWRSVVLFLVGALIAATGILEWRRLVFAILSHLEADGQPRSGGRALLWFFLRLLGAACLLYVSLRCLDGKVSALVAGLAVAMVALLIEAVRIFHSWSA